MFYNSSQVLRLGEGHPNLCCISFKGKHLTPAQKPILVCEWKRQKGKARRVNGVGSLPVK